jgi:hypothetical protein
MVLLLRVLLLALVLPVMVRRGGGNGQRPLQVGRRRSRTGVRGGCSGGGSRRRSGRNRRAVLVGYRSLQRPRHPGTRPRLRDGGQDFSQVRRQRQLLLLFVFGTVAAESGSWMRCPRRRG